MIYSHFYRCTRLARRLAFQRSEPLQQSRDRSRSPRRRDRSRSPRRGLFLQSCGRDRSRSPRRGHSSQGGGGPTRRGLYTLQGYLEDWAWGEISAPRVRKYCRNALKDGLRHPLLRNVAALDASTTQNAHRTLLNRFCKANEFDLIQPLPDSSVGHYLPPHLLFKALHANYPAQFVKRFGANPTKLQWFWDTFLRTQHGREMQLFHPHMQAGRDWSHTLPIICYCDGAPYTKKRSVKVSVIQCWHLKLH